MCRRIVLGVCAVLVFVDDARAQSFEIGAYVVSSQWSEFDGADAGVGGRVAWKPAPPIGVEGELAWYPADFPDRVAFSGGRVEGLFGITAGPRLDRVRPFARAAAGFLRSSGAPEPFPCIAIFPPPLACLMGAGHMMPALDLGGGIELDVTAAMFVRMDLGARMLRYPGPSFRSTHDIRDDGFWGAALRLSIGGGFRF